MVVETCGFNFSTHGGSLKSTWYWIRDPHRLLVLEWTVRSIRSSGTSLEGEQRAIGKEYPLVN